MSGIITSKRFGFTELPNHFPQGSIGINGLMSKPTTPSQIRSVGRILWPLQGTAAWINGPNG